jgi:hypothetical protein
MTHAHNILSSAACLQFVSRDAPHYERASNVGFGVARGPSPSPLCLPPARLCGSHMGRCTSHRPLLPSPSPVRFVCPDRRAGLFFQLSEVGAIVSPSKTEAAWRGAYLAPRGFY